MIDIKKETENILKVDWHNTNGKEQNFQGWLYANFLKLLPNGYTIELESNIKKDEHLQPLRDKIGDCNSLKKSEIDILIYNSGFSEVHAIELKWRYEHGNEKWSVADQIEEYEKDIDFCEELKECGLTSAISLVVYNFAPQRQTRFTSTNERKKAFVGNDYKKGDIPQGCSIKGIPFEWKEFYNDEGKEYYYYLIEFK